jgi:[acyl-carrier-protein] S-malonyltransferase
VAVVFPGQGAAAPGAGLPWVDHPAWSVVTDAEAVLDRPLARLLLEADADELATTRSSQLAVLLTSLVVWEAARTSLPRPVAFAGHSLGQITALIASGAVSAAHGYRLAAARADASQDSADANPGRMAALIGAEVDIAEAACAGVDEAWLANDNAPGQVVIAGTPAGLEAAAEQAKALGVRRVVTLGVGHAFHTPLLADAAQALAPLLEATPFDEPAAPIVANTDARPHTDPAGWPHQLTRHLVEPVRWRTSQDTLASELGARVMVELGPGNVLAGLARRTIPDVPVRSAASPDEVAALAEFVAAASAPDLTSSSKGAP